MDTCFHNSHAILFIKFEETENKLWSSLKTNFKVIIEDFFAAIPNTVSTYHNFISIKKIEFEPVHEISNNVVCAASKASDQPAHTMIVKLLTEHHLEFLSLKYGCTGSSESRHVKMPHCWKSHALAQFYLICFTVVCEKEKREGRLLYVPVHEISNNVAF